MQAALLAGMVVSASPLIVAAHSGGLDAKGCHTNRKTGEYHCHRAQAAPEPQQDAQQEPQQAADASQKQPVKMSKSGICHDTSSPWYEQTQNYTPYSSMSACIRAGGRPPKN